MCGIAGMLERGQRRGGDLAEVAAAMAGTLRHRGPDDAGVWTDPAAGVALAHRRLAVVDLSVEGHQPMVSASGRFVLDFNGEVYNHRQLRTELEAAGRRFRGHSDTEVLVEAIDAWGLRQALERTNAMFALAVWDAKARTLTLARDRIGEKPVYWAELGSTLVFGSELKALEAHPAFTGEVDRGALALYMRLGYLPSPHSIYAGVAKLPPGHLLVAGDRGVAVSAWWDAPSVLASAVADRRPRSEREVLDALDALLADA